MNEQTIRALMLSVCLQVITHPNGYYHHEAVQNAVDYGIERRDLQPFKTLTATTTTTTTRVSLASESSIERDLDRFRTLFATGKVT